MRGEMVSLDEYVARCPPEQKEIYFLCAPSRDLAVQSPYLEAFEKVGREVMFVYTAMDDFVMANLEKFEGRNLVSVEKSDIDLGDSSEEGDDKDADKANAVQLSEEDAKEFCAWFQMTLNEKVSSCKVTSRLSNSPAMVTDSESGAMRRMMRFVETQSGGQEGMPLPKQQVEINPKHPIIVALNSARKDEELLATVCAEQIFDNCLIAAGLLDDGRTMLPRLNDILLTVVKDWKDTESTEDKQTAE